MAVRTDAAGNLVGRLSRAPTRPRGRCCSARTSTRCATRAPSTGRSACSPRSRASSGCARRERAALRDRGPGLQRRGGRCATAPPTSAAARWPGASSPRCSTLVDDDGVDARRRAARLRRRTRRRSAAPRAAASGCSATARCTSSRDRCSRAATCRSGWSARSPGPTRAELEFAGAPGTPAPCRWTRGTTRACAAAEWVLAVEAAARREPALVATVGRLRGAARARPTSCPARAVASLDVRHADDARARGGGERAARRGAADRRRRAASRWRGARS